MSIVDEIKDRLDIVDVISQYVPLKKAGRNFKGLCPFHAEKTPSFVVFPDTGTWHCFGACGTGGDIFTFIMKIERVDFPEALRMLAEKAGVLLETHPTGDKEEEDRLARLRAVVKAAAEFFHQLLLYSPHAEKAREYVAGRGLSDNTVAAFQLGYAPAEWEALQRHLTAKGYSLSEMEEAGLIIAREGGGYYDRFRHRLVIPICDRRGQVIGFGARALDDTEPKYLNSPQTPLFDKGTVLFGLDKAAKPIRARNEAIIVEGYMDVMAAHQYGVDNVVASMGTALTETQLRALARLATRLILALDADIAGDQATLRGLNLARQTVGRRKVPALLPDGSLGQQERLAVDLRILTLPEGMDPDELIRQDIIHWRELVQKAQPLVDYYLAHVLQNVDLTNPASKSAAVAQMKPILLELQDEIERYHYIQLLARRLMLDERIVERQVLGERGGPQGGRSARRRRRPPSVLHDDATPPEVGRREITVEDQCLIYLLLFPRIIYPLSYAFAEANIPFLEAGDFQRVENQVIFSRIRAGAEEGTLPGQDELVALFPGPVQEHILRLAAHAQEVDISEDEAAEDVVRCALQVKARRTHIELAKLHFILQEAEEAGETEDMARYEALVANASSTLAAIHHALFTHSLRGKKALAVRGEELDM